MIQEQVDLTALNTFQIHAVARYFARIKTNEELQEIRSSAIFRNNPVLILGGGSNILFTRDFPGLVVHSKLKGITIGPEVSPDEVLITAAAGENWHELVSHCVNKNLGGLENLALIPGYCGAAPIQNIGAYGKELSQVLEWVDAIDLESGEERRFMNAECDFGYRDSLFKRPEGKKFFISSITLRVSTKNHFIDAGYSALREELKHLAVSDLSIKDIFNAVIQVRTRKLPDTKLTGNAGSFFKNPVVGKSEFEILQHSHPAIPFYSIDNQHFKIPAAWFIEQAGWKGKHSGAAGCHSRQPLVMINLGGASGNEILAFSETIRQDVESKFGVQLEREVNVC